MATERVESVLELITYTKGVLGAVVCNRDGEPIRDSFQDLDRSKAVAYAEMAADLAREAAPLLSADDAMDVLRVRSRTNEVIIKCHEEFLLVVIQELTRQLDSADLNAFSGRLASADLPPKDPREAEAHVKLIHDMQKNQHEACIKESRDIRNMRTLRKEAVSCWESSLSQFSKSNKKKMQSFILKCGAPAALRPPVWAKAIGKHFYISKNAFEQSQLKLKDLAPQNDLCSRLIHRFLSDLPCDFSSQTQSTVTAPLTTDISIHFAENIPNGSDSTGANSSIDTNENSTNYNGNCLSLSSENIPALPLLETHNTFCLDYDEEVLESDGHDAVGKNGFVQRGYLNSQNPLMPCEREGADVRIGAMEYRFPCDKVQERSETNISSKLDENGLRQVELLLRAHVMLRERVPFTQGMPYLAAMLHLVMPDSNQAFVCFANLVEYTRFPFFLGGDLMELFDVILAEGQPELHKLFKQYGVTPMMYLHDWWATMFCRALPFETAMRCWDLILIDDTYMYRIALALLVYLFEVHAKGKSANLRAAYTSSEVIMLTLGTNTSRQYVNESLFFKIVKSDSLCGMTKATIHALVKRKEKNIILTRSHVPNVMAIER